MARRNIQILQRGINCTNWTQNISKYGGKIVGKQVYDSVLSRGTQPTLWRILYCSKGQEFTMIQTEQ